ncbi:hexokinase-1 [Xylaria bambusicola]|uniref:hexokinase-1 n=1 Tax=Xylaria bambusicola TaxID=326684 RepID=UPI002008C734|nr:hexokinase-1 [Xylaria bambusicola]KAI0506041.1 hexokinase-1 [Xylaria bambusicola]
MRPLASAMTTLRKSLLAALKSFLRGKSFLQVLFAFWISPRKLKEQDTNGRPIKVSRTIAEFLKEAEKLLLSPIEGDRLRTFSSDLKAQFRERLQTHPECMLPSFNHLLPTGKEVGQYLALDVGGSTLRVALVALRGRETRGRECEIVRMISFKITPEIKRLEGMAFFDWMAMRIHEVIHKDEIAKTQDPIPMGLAWSFPVEQISLGGGLLMGMGKGFLATSGLLGQDLGGIIQSACLKHGLNVQLASIINDGSATLLSQAYTHAETRFGLILGTGTNIAVHLPVSAIGRLKYGRRPKSWFDSASHVIVNTELGMFGHDILPETRWDTLLNASHPRPEFQPLEHYLSGYYLGEICRLAIVEAVETTGLLGGELPPSLTEPYSLDTEILSRMEADTSSTLEKALLAFTSAHPCPIPATPADIGAIRTLASFISRRSAALLGAAVFSLWELRYETAAEQACEEEKPVASATTAEEDLATPPHTKVAFNGSVIEHYPGYLGRCQAHITGLVAGAGNPVLAAGSIDLVPAVESSIIGAAVALGCALAEGQTS